MQWMQERRFRLSWSSAADDTKGSESGFEVLVVDEGLVIIFITGYPCFYNS